ncbi:MAG: sensor histidine kinase [Bryobacterales bacterium]|nr:sensor histidine kinase [Bryobacterales bacterium]
MIRAGFGLVLGLLLFSTVEAYRIQRGLSDEAVLIYHRHNAQDDAIYRLRRQLWLGANSSRDFLLNPAVNREQEYRQRLQSSRDLSVKLLRQLDEIGNGSEVTPRLRAKLHEYWDVLDRVPQDTGPLTSGQRYQYVQREIAARRSALGDVLHEFAEVSRKAFKENEEALTASRRESALHLLFILGLSMVLAFTVAAFSLAHSEGLERKTERQYAEVAQAKAGLQHLAARLMDIQEEERTRISRELHDEIGQALATLRMEISRAESIARERLPEVAARLQRARGMAERTVQTVRGMCSLLRPSLLDDLGLGAALEWLAEDFMARGGVPCSLHQSALSEDLPDPVKTCVYRVVQESLHNCEKHAYASAVHVNVTQAESSLSVSVEDNGVGFVDEERRPPTKACYGILGMQERAAALGGTLDVTSSPGSGTKICLVLPLKLAVEGWALLNAGETSA